MPVCTSMGSSRLLCMHVCVCFLIRSSRHCLEYTVHIKYYLNLVVLVQLLCI